jgi:hypothetical protein
MSCHRREKGEEKEEQDSKILKHLPLLSPFLTLASTLLLLALSKPNLKPPQLSRQ